jgi:outer membrane protein assembly factor BamD
MHTLKDTKQRNFQRPKAAHPLKQVHIPITNKRSQTLNIQIAIVILRSMKKLLVYSSFCLFILALSACKSSFEKVRSSGNADLILKEAFTYYDKGEYQKAQSLFELVINNLRGRQDSEKAYFQYADTYYKLKEYTLSGYYFKQFVNTFSNTPRKEEALFLSAYSHYLMAPSYRLEQSETQKAIEELQIFSNQFPSSEKVAECNKLIDQLRKRLEAKAYAEGELYYNLKQYQSAMLSFENLLRDYPESADAEQVRYLLCKSAYSLATNSVLDKKQERFEEAIEKANVFIAKYPKGKNFKEVKDMRKEALDLKKQLTKVNG